MRKSNLIILLFLSMVLAAQAQIQHFEWQGVQRDYLVRTPAEFNETMPVLYFLHGLGDNITRGMDLGLSVDEILDYWKNANHCVDEPVIDTFPDLHNDGLRFIRYTYDGDAELQHIKVIGGNHSWYHSDTQYDISYLNEIHRFFVTGSGGNVGLTEPQTTNLCFWPNPTSGSCNVSVDADSNLEIIDLHGRVMFKRDVKKGVNQLDLRVLPEGLYIVKTSEGKTMKVMVK